MQSLYDLSYWLRIDSSPETEEAQVLNLLDNNHCRVELNLPPRRKNSDYPIKKETSAYFGTIYFWADKKNIPKIEKAIANLPNILRFLIIKRKNLPQSLRKSAETPATINVGSNQDSS